MFGSFLSHNPRVSAMSFDAGQVDVFDRVTRLLRHASRPSEALICEIATACCIRLPDFAGAGKTGRSAELVKAGAWLDATLAIIESELAQWSLHRLLYADGDWHCSLSRHEDLPIEFDDAADGYHAVLPLAVLMAFVEGCRRRDRDTTGVVSTANRRSTELGV
jgi:hypothetical protein